MSLMERLNRAKAELSEGGNDPWRRMLERALPGNVTCTSNGHAGPSIGGIGPR